MRKPVWNYRFWRWRSQFAENILWKVEEADIEGELVIFKIFIKFFGKGKFSSAFCLTCRVKVISSAYVISSRSRSSRSQKFFKIGALKNFANFTGKQLCWSLFLIKLQALFLRTPFLQNTSSGCFCNGKFATYQKHTHCKILCLRQQLVNFSRFTNQMERWNTNINNAWKTHIIRAPFKTSVLLVHLWQLLKQLLLYIFGNLWHVN